MKAGVRDYLVAAFNARPIGMLVPPNWVGLAAFGLLGLLTPGFWLIGAGLEVAYLYTLASSPRFQRTVEAGQLHMAQADWTRREVRLIRDLSGEDQKRYRALEARCRTILAQQIAAGTSAVTIAQGEGLRRLLWIYLRLLVTRQAINKVLAEASSGSRTIDSRIGSLEEQLASGKISDQLRKSLSGQVDILKQRVEKQRQARDKLAFLEAELIRIQEQAELIREQGALSADPDSVSSRIDAISETLGGTMEWIGEQQRLYGNVEDLMSEPPPITLEPAKESQ